MESGIPPLGPIALLLRYPIPFYSICLVMMFVAALVWWWLPNRQNQLAARKALRSDLSLFFAGAVVALGVIGAIIQFQANIERDQRQERLALSSENGKRFDNAVGQLQKKSDLARLGGIYALGGLIKQDGYYWSSVTQLVGYLRQVAQPNPSEPSETEKNRSNRTEIHNLLHLLSERDVGNWTNRFSEPFPLDLASLILKDLRFSGLKLWGGNFRRSDLSGSHLPGAKLEGADFYCANFENTVFQRAYLHDDSGFAELGPKLSRANFRNANLNGVDFKKNNYGTVEVHEACFEGASLNDADLSGFDVKAVRGLTKQQFESSKGQPKAPPDFQEIACVPYKRCQ